MVADAVIARALSKKNISNVRTYVRSCRQSSLLLVER